MHRIVLLALLLLAVACGGGGGGGVSFGVIVVVEQEPNGNSLTANPLPEGRAATGLIAASTDIDFWSFPARAGEWLTIELVATRLDQEGWDDACNVGRLTLWDTDGVTRLLEHDFIDAWPLGRPDMDIPLWRVPATGTYFVCVISDAPGADGAEYSLVVRRNNLGTPQQEAELVGQTGVNDTPLSAQVINLGRLQGHHQNGNPDWYRFTANRAGVACFEMVSSRNGRYRTQAEYYSPRLRLYQADGSTLVASADGVYFDDPFLCARLPTGGVYFLEVTQADDGGHADYTLTFSFRNADALPVETEPNDTALSADGVFYGVTFQGSISTADTDFFSFAGTAGDQVLLELLPAVAGTQVLVEFFKPDGATVQPADRDTFGGITSTRTILPSTGTYFFRVTALSAQPMVYVVALSRRQGAAFETESNGTIGNADGFDGSGRAAGVIGSDVDVDVYRFSARENELVIVSCLAKRMVRGAVGSDGFRPVSGNGSQLQPRLRILTDTGAELARSVYTPLNACSSAESVFDGAPTLAVAFIAPAAGTYYVEVAAEDGTGGPNHTYLLQRR